MKYFNLFDLQARALIKLARELAVSFEQKEVEPEHILLAILKTPKCTAFELVDGICNNTASMQVRLETLLMKKKTDREEECNPGFSRRSVILLTQAFQEMTRTSSGKISSEHILLAMCFERFGSIAKLFSEFELSRNLIEMWLIAKKRSRIDELKQVDEVEEILLTEVIVHKSREREKEESLQIDADIFPILKLLNVIAEKSVVYAVSDYLMKNDYPVMQMLKPVNLAIAVMNCKTGMMKTVRNELIEYGLNPETLKELSSIESVILLFQEEPAAEIRESLEEIQRIQYNKLSLLNLCLPVTKFLIHCLTTASEKDEPLLTPERIIVEYIKSVIGTRNGAFESDGSYSD